MPAGGGDAGVPGRFQDADGQVAQGGHGLGSAAGADLGGVFAVADVAEVVQGLDLPVAADPAGWGQVSFGTWPPADDLFRLRPPFPEQFVHDGRTVLDHRADLLPVDQLRNGRPAVTNQQGDLFDRHAAIGQQRYEAVPQLSRRPARRCQLREPGVPARRAFAADLYRGSSKQ